MGLAAVDALLAEQVHSDRTRAKALFWRAYIRFCIPAAGGAPDTQQAVEIFQEAEALFPAGVYKAMMGITQYRITT